SSIPSRSALSREGTARVLALIARSLGTLSGRGVGGGEHDVGDRLDCTLIASAWRWFCAVDEALDDGQRLPPSRAVDRGDVLADDSQKNRIERNRNEHQNRQGREASRP